MKHLFFTILLGLFISSNASAQLDTINYGDAKQPLRGFAKKPIRENKSKPGILLLPAWKGIDMHSKETAVKLSKLGYHTFIADIYGKDKAPNSTEEAGKLSGYYKQNFTEYQKRIKLALDQLIKYGADPNNIVVIGYCFGGTGALEAARGELAVKGVVSFHGGLSKDIKRENKPIAAQVLVLHGADDPYVPAEDVAAFQKEMRESKADWQMVYYSDAVHAFSDPFSGNDPSTGAAYNEKAAKRSWNHLLVFLRDILK